MKLCILSDEQDVDAAQDVIRLIKTLNITVDAYTIKTHWRADVHRLDEYLASATHLVVIYSKNSIASAWLSFAAGFAFGSEKPLVLYRPSRHPAHAQYLTPFFLVSSLEELSVFFESENREWENINQRREARRALLELGISFKGDAFAEAVTEGNAHAVTLFLQAGLPADTLDKKGVPLLSLAARQGNKALIKLLLEAGASVNMQSEDRGNTALMDAVAGGYQEVCKLLLEAGTDVNIKSKDDQTALIIAVGKNDVSGSALLMDHGADPDISDKLGFSARKYANLFHNPEMKKLFES